MPHTATAGATPHGARPATGLGDMNSVWYALTPLLKDPVDPMGTLLRVTQKYGGAIRVRLGDRHIVFLSDVDHFKHVLVTKESKYIKYFDGLKPIFGNAMITIDGALWQKVRAPQQAAFHPNKLGDYLPYFLKALRGKAERWDGLASDGNPIEMVEETWTLAADMVCQGLFDREMPFNPHTVFGYVKTYTDVQNHAAIRHAKQTTGEMTKTNTDAEEAMEAWAGVPQKVIDAPIIDHRTDTLLSILQAAEADPHMPEFDRAQVIDEIKQYLWAGTETTALTLAWCFYLLSQNPEVADKIRAEADEVCGPGEPNWEQAQRLVYTRRVIQETMRIYPPVWSFIREAAAEDEIDGVKIEPGDTVVLCSYAVHHSPKYWTDPHLFNPDRFAPDRMKSRAKYSYLPFAAGKRSCIGGALSQLENGLALAMLLRKFQPEYLGEVPARVAPTVTLTPAGLPFRIRRL